MPWRGNIRALTETGREAGVSTYEWEIPSFLSLAAEVGDWYSSLYFNACNEVWLLTIFPNGMGHCSGGCCDLLLRRYNGGAKTFSVMAGIRGMKGVRRREKLVKEFRPPYDGCSWFQFCKRDQLREEEMLNGESLIVTLEVTTDELKDASSQNLEASGGAPIEDKEPSGKKDASPKALVASTEAAEEIQPLEKKGSEKVLEDIGKLLVSGENCDVTVQVGDAEFKAHSLILCARCPVLSAMLKHNTAERASGKITVRDCKSDVFGDFLHYIYQGSVQHLSEKNVFDLYCFADQYLAEDLKQECLEYIWDTLSVQTFCDTVRLALRHEQGDLLKQAIEFASKNLRLIVRTVEWQVFHRDYPTESNEILIKALDPDN